MRQAELLKSRDINLPSFLSIAVILPWYRLYKIKIAVNIDFYWLSLNNNWRNISSKYDSFFLGK